MPLMALVNAPVPLSLPIDWHNRTKEALMTPQPSTGLVETDYADIAEKQPAEAPQMLGADELGLVAGGPAIDNEPR